MTTRKGRKGGGGVEVEKRCALVLFPSTDTDECSVRFELSHGIKQPRKTQSDQVGSAGEARVDGRRAG